MATLLTNKPRFYNNDGTLASGGKLYTYYAGTSTPISTYSDAAGTTPNTNPVILDAKGEADIWVTGVIKINLLQSDDVQVTGYPIDNVNYPAVTIWTDRGNFDASVNTYPTTGGSGVGGAILTGDVWTISVVATAGVLNGQLVGTTVRALADTPAQVVASWGILDVGLGASNAAAVAAAVSTAADLVLTNADVVLTHADVVLTHADVVLTNADVVTTTADVATCLAYAQAMNLNDTTDTSSSSVAIGLGAKTFTVTAGKSFVPGMFLVMADAAAPSTNSMDCQVTSYSGTTLLVNCILFYGSGTKSSWNISFSGDPNVNAVYAYDGKNALITTDSNLETWADALPGVGKYKIIITAPQGNLPAGAWYIEFNRDSSDAVGNLYHAMIATVAGGATGNGAIYMNTCKNGVWSGWGKPDAGTADNAIKLNSTEVTVTAHATTGDIFAAAGNSILWDDSGGPVTATIFPNAAQAGMVVECRCNAASSFTAGANLLIEGVVSGKTITLGSGAYFSVRAVTATQFYMTYRYSGSFTMSATGFSGAVNGTVYFLHENGKIFINIPTGTITGTSNATTFTLTGLPASIVPPSARELGLVYAWDNSAAIVAHAGINSGVAVINLNVFSGAWTASGTKSLHNSELIYSLY